MSHEQRKVHSAEHTWYSDDDGRQAEVLTTLRSTFGHPAFRPLQEEIVTTILAGRDVFALMPTGGGKSLCYQLPALLLPGLTLVISPLIALMQDQVEQLEALGVPATFINSSLDSDEIRRRAVRVHRGEVKLLYVAPERLMTSGFQRLLASVPLSFVAVDEAHCISEWGHDFRPEYRELSQFREMFPDVVWGAFTATATPRVQADIRRQLRLEQAATFQGSFNRPNLFYEVRPKENAFDQLVDYLRGRPRDSGIIYCLSRSGVESLAEQLRSHGFDAVAYHAGLESDERRDRQEAFRRDETQIIVATVAFGMGIDKPDVRFVIHYDVPPNLERYYQESGRAGRDGKPADCVLFYSASDLQRHRWFIDQKPDETERRVALAQLRAVAAWAEGSDCRRESLLAYFDERFDGKVEPCCDACEAPSELIDYTIPAQKFLSCVARTRQRFGSSHIIAVLRGSRSQRVLSLAHDQLSTYGIGRDRSAAEWRRVARELVKRGYVAQDSEGYNTLRLTERARAVLFEDEPVLLPKPMHVVRKARSDDGAYHPELFERLRTLRKELADERGVPPYVIFHDRTLRAIAGRLPVTEEDVRAIPGIGTRKVEEFGEAVLATVAAFVAETGAQPVDATAEPASPPRPAPRAGKKTTVEATLKLFEQGLSPAEIAEHRGLAPSTIASHLAQAIEQGASIDIDVLVSPETQRRIAEALDLVGWDALGPVKAHLGDDVSYDEIKYVRAALRRQA